MKTTAIDLGPYWEGYIQKQIESGRYASPTEVILESLRLLEERQTKLDVLRKALIEGEQSGSAGPLDMEEIKRKAKEQAGLITSNA